MPSSITQFFKRAIFGEEPIHPVERRLAKEWIKKRLARVYPELRGNPVALEKAYRELGLSARPGETEEEPETVFEVRLPSSVSKN